MRRFCLGSNKVMQHALGRDAESEVREGVAALATRISGNVGLLFTSLPQPEVSTARWLACAWPSLLSYAAQSGLRLACLLAFLLRLARPCLSEARNCGRPGPAVASICASEVTSHYKLHRWRRSVKTSGLRTLPGRALKPARTFCCQRGRWRALKAHLPTPWSPACASMACLCG